MGLSINRMEGCVRRSLTFWVSWAILNAGALLCLPALILAVAAGRTIRGMVAVGHRLRHA